MPDVMDSFGHLNEASQGELTSRYQDLKASAPHSELPDAVLQELIAIARVLRKRASAPTAKKPAAKNVVPTLDAL